MNALQFWKFGEKIYTLTLTLYYKQGAYPSYFTDNFNPIPFQICKQNQNVIISSRNFNNQKTSILQIPENATLPYNEEYTGDLTQYIFHLFNYRDFYIKITTTDEEFLLRVIAFNYRQVVINGVSYFYVKIPTSTITKVDIITDEMSYKKGSKPYEYDFNANGCKSVISQNQNLDGIKLIL